MKSVPIIIYIMIFDSHLCQGLPDTALCDKVHQWQAECNTYSFLYQKLGLKDIT